MAWTVIYQFGTGTGTGGSSGPGAWGGPGSGSRGEPGTSILSGSGVPASTQGRPSDIYFQANGVVWQKTNPPFGQPPAWKKLATLVGPAGPPGRPGAPGQPGPVGPRGASASALGLTLTDILPPTASYSFAGWRLLNLGTPINSTDAATKGYIDLAGQQLDWKQHVRLATTSKLPAYTNAVPGTLIGVANGAISVDGVPLATGDRILVKNETGTVNGIYSVNYQGDAGAPYSLQRSIDASDTTPLTAGATVRVIEGGVNPGTIWGLRTADPITVNASDLQFDLMNPPAAPSRSGNQGPPGQAGATWFASKTVPPRSLGNVGDFCLQANGDVFQKSSLAFGVPPAWAKITTLLGPQGKPGTAGQPGAAGIPGPPGSSGSGSATSLGTAKVIACLTFPAGVATLDATHVLGVSSITDNGAGDTTVTFTVPFTTANYVAVTSAEANTADFYLLATLEFAGKAAGSVRVVCWRYDFFNRGDPNSQSLVCWGVQ